MERVMIEKNTIKSQDNLIDCNNGKRSSETLIETISKLETTIEKLEKMTELYTKAKWWLNEIVSNHRFTPISTAEMAIKDLKELEK